jgi:hypothetical protein
LNGPTPTPSSTIDLLAEARFTGICSISVAVSMYSPVPGSVNADFIEFIHDPS